MRLIKLINFVFENFGLGGVLLLALLAAGAYAVYAAVDRQSK